MISNFGEMIKSVDQQFQRKGIPHFHVGDSVKMKVKVQEADKVRLHPFEGIVIRKTGRGLKATFTVRKISFGEGVERIFPVHSPVIEELKVVNKGISRRSKLYYLRDHTGKKSRLAKEQTQEPALAAG